MQHHSNEMHLSQLFHKCGEKIVINHPKSHIWAKKSSRLLRLFGLKSKRMLWQQETKISAHQPKELSKDNLATDWMKMLSAFLQICRVRCCPHARRRGINLEPRNFGIQSTWGPIRLLPRCCWHQIKCCILVQGAYTETQPLFWSFDVKQIQGTTWWITL